MARKAAVDVKGIGDFVVHAVAWTQADVAAGHQPGSWLERFFPAWKRPAANTAIARWDTPDPRPYPEDPLAQLVWLATSGAEIWTPTRRELRELRAQKIQAVAHPNGEPDQPLAEREVLNEPPRADDDYYSSCVRAPSDYAVVTQQNAVP